MPKISDRFSTVVPKYRRHKASGQALVTLGGRDFYLGDYGTKASRAEYERRVGEWLSSGRQRPLAAADLTVSEVLARYWKFAEVHYRKDGEPTGELNNIRLSARRLVACTASLWCVILGRWHSRPCSCK